MKKTVGRLASYLQGYGDLLVTTNRWDPAALERFRADPVVTSFRGAIDDKADTATLEHIAGLLPDAWLEPAATGSPHTELGPAPSSRRSQGPVVSWVSSRAHDGFFCVRLRSRRFRLRTDSWAQRFPRPPTAGSSG